MGYRVKTRFTLLQAKAWEAKNMQCETECCSHTDMLLFLAKKAKYELLKEKIKAKIDTQHGEEMEKIAESLLAGMAQFDTDMEKSEERRDKLEERLSKIFD